jgi:hypothetical protein
MVGSINSSRRVHQDEARTLQYVHYWLSICCSTPSPLPSPAGLTPFNLLQINSDGLAGRLNRFDSSSTSLQCKDAGVRPLLAYELPLYSSPLPPPPGLTYFELLQINSDWLAGRLTQFVSSSALRRGKDTAVRPLLALDSLLYSSSCQVDPLQCFSDQHRLTH